MANGGPISHVACACRHGPRSCRRKMGSSSCPAACRRSTNVLRDSLSHRAWRTALAGSGHTGRRSCDDRRVGAPRLARGTSELELGRRVRSQKKAGADGSRARRNDFQSLRMIAGALSAIQSGDRLGQLVGVDHPTARKAPHDLVLAFPRHRKTAFRATELTVERNHVILGVPGVMDYDRARFSVAVAVI